MRRFLTSTLLSWDTGNLSDYKVCHRLYGGSFIAHPDVLEFFHSRHDCQPQFYVKRDSNGDLVGAFCAWSGFHLAGDTTASKQCGIAHYPFNRDEVILPFHPKLNVILPVKTKILSGINASVVLNSTFKMNSNRAVCIAKGYGENGFSSATKNSRNRELKHFIKAGGKVVDQVKFTPKELGSIYSDLFKKRWNKRPNNHQQIIDMMENLRSFFFGHVLFIGDEPCAFQLITKAESPEWINFDYVNGGYDTDHKSFSPGTIVTWVNIQSAYAICESLGKKMRYSFGRPTADYKKRWCNNEPVGRVLAL